MKSPTGVNAVHHVRLKTGEEFHAVSIHTHREDKSLTFFEAIFPDRFQSIFECFENDVDRIEQVGST
jgi:hypothetical protein